MRRQLVVYATGLGKTATAMAVPWNAVEGRVLFLAHRKELLTQAFGAARLWNPGTRVSLEHDVFRATDDDDIVIASVQGIGKEGSKRLRDFGRSHFDTIIVDEAHRTAAAMHLRSLDRFSDHGLLIGITATPFRADGVELSNIYDEIVDERTIEWGIDNGWLCELRPYWIKSKVDISDVETRGSDFVEASLDEQVNTDYRNSLIWSALNEYAHDRRRALIFSASVNHAKILSEQLSAHGWPARWVSGSTGKKQREEAIAWFGEDTQDRRCLVGCDVFIEGFDEPKIDCLVLGKPTKSLGRFSQMLGRGTRTHESKPDTIVLDIVDVCSTHDVCRVSDMFGAREVDLLGMPLSQAIKRLKQAKEKGVDTSGKDIAEVDEEERQLSAIMGGRLVELPTKAVQLDLFSRVTKPAPEVDAGSVFKWMKLGASSYLLPVNRRLSPKLTSDAVGNWRLEYRGDGMSVNTHALGKSDRPPFKEADKHMKKAIEAATGKPWRMFSRTAQWRNRPAENSDISRLREKGISVYPSDLTRGAAIDLANFLDMGGRKG